MAECKLCIEKDAEIKELRLIVTTRTALVEREERKNERLEAKNAELQSEIQDREADKREHEAIAYEREVRVIGLEKEKAKLRATVLLQAREMEKDLEEGIVFADKLRTENAELREALKSVAGAAHECLKNEWCPDLAVVALECIKKTASNILANTETDDG